jgi:peptide/nickel transport system ATP-binding protein
MKHSPSADAAAVLTVDGLRVGIAGASAVRNVSFRVVRGEAVGIVGESGSGKTLTCRSILGLLPPGSAITDGRILLGDTELTGLDERSWQRVRGGRLGAVFQDPASYLNPGIKVGRQLGEVLRIKHGLGRAPARERALRLLSDVGLSSAHEVYHQYVHELSGGMSQRVMLAIAVAGRPELLVADEATTALDVVVQAEVLALLRTLRADYGLSLLMVAHDLAVVADVCDRILVFYAGELVEEGPTEQVLTEPAHPYTRRLLRVAGLRLDHNRELETIPGRPLPAHEELGGCRFAPRCEFATPECAVSTVPIREIATDRRARCVRLDDVRRVPA